MTPARTYRLILEIDNHFPNLRPSAVRLTTVKREGNLECIPWQQLRQEFEAMLAQVKAERASKPTVEGMKRQKRRYD